MLPLRPLQRSTTSRVPPEEARYQQMLQGTSLLCLGPHSWLRRLAARIITSKPFDPAVLVLILASSVALALDMPSLSPESQLKQVGGRGTVGAASTVHRRCRHPAHAPSYSLTGAGMR